MSWMILWEKSKILENFRLFNLFLKNWVSLFVMYILHNSLSKLCYYYFDLSNLMAHPPKNIALYCPGTLMHVWHYKESIINIFLRKIKLGVKYAHVLPYLHIDEHEILVDHGLQFWKHFHEANLNMDKVGSTN